MSEINNARKNQLQNIEKNYRKLSDLAFSCEEILESKDKTQQDFVLIGVLYELVTNLKMLYFSMRLCYTSDGYLWATQPLYDIYARKTIESQLFYEALHEFGVDSLNYKLYRHQLWQKKFGEKESNKIAKELHIHPNQINAYIIKSKRPFYMFGMISDFSKSRTILKEILEKIKDSDYEVIQSYLSSYDAFSFSNHYSSITDLTSKKLQMEQLFFNIRHFEELTKSLKRFLKPQMITPGVIIDSDHEVKIKSDLVLKDILGMSIILKQAGYEIEYHTLFEFASLLDTLATCHVNYNDFEFLPYLKYFFERLANFDRIYTNYPFGKRNKAFEKVEKCLEASLKYSILNDDSTMRSLYNEIKEELGSMAYDRFKVEYSSQPNKIIDNKTCSFRDGVKMMLQNINSENNDIYLKIYELSCVLSHTNGFLLRYKTLNSKNIIKIFIEFVSKAYDYFFKYISDCKIVDFKSLENNELGLSSISKLSEIDFSEFANSLMGDFETDYKDILDLNLDIIPEDED